MITLTREEAQQVADSLAGYRREMNEAYPCDAERMLVAKLAQPEPEPVAWHEPGAYGNVTVYKEWATENGWLPLYKERI